MISYSHRNHYLRHILLNAKSLFPGAISATSVYYDSSSFGLIIDDLSLIEESPILKELSLSAFDSEQLLQLRKQKLRYSWLNSPFSEESRQDDQLKIQTEYEKHTLLIRFPNKTSGLNDLLFIFFKNEEQLFRFTSKSAKLSTELKQSIASIYVRSLDVIRMQIENDAEINEVLSDHIISSEQKEESHKSDLEEKDKKELQFYKSIVEKESKAILVNHNLKVEWSDEALKKLIADNADIYSLETAVKKALIIGLNETKVGSQTFTIKSKHLSSSDLVANIPIPQNEIIESQKRTYLLLDRYEKAAIQVLKAQQSLTGAHLGQFLSPPVTAAAISDAIRKHSQKITNLLQKYPNRWEIIRKQFRPIQNKVTYSFRDDQLAS